MTTSSEVIRGWKESADLRQTSEPSLIDTKKRVKPEWLKKWLRLENRHPRIQKVEKEVGEFCRDVWESPGHGRLLVLYGDNGTGKTHCAKAVHRWIGHVGHTKQWVEQTGVISSLKSLMWFWPEFLDALKNGQWDITADCLATPVLILDEVGGDHDPSKVGADKLCQILSRRENRWTLLTTNVKPEAWAERFDERIASRLARNSRIVNLEGVPDFYAS